VAKAATATLRYEAFEARHCVRRLTPATLGVHLRDLFAMNGNGYGKASDTPSPT